MNGAEWSITTIQWLGGNDLELGLFIFPKKNGEPGSYLEFSNHLVDYEYVEFKWVYDQYVIICGL